MLTYGGREATSTERIACLDFVSHFSQQQETLQLPEAAVLETDSYGRVMVFLRVLHEDGLEEPLLIIFKEIRPDGGYLAGPKSILLCHFQTAHFLFYYFSPPISTKAGMAGRGGDPRF